MKGEIGAGNVSGGVLRGSGRRKNPMLTRLLSRATTPRLLVFGPCPLLQHRRTNILDATRKWQLASKHAHEGECHRRRTDAVVGKFSIRCSHGYKPQSPSMPAPLNVMARKSSIPQSQEAFPQTSSLSLATLISLSHLPLLSFHLTPSHRNHALPNIRIPPHASPSSPEPQVASASRSPNCAPRTP